MGAQAALGFPFFLSLSLSLSLSRPFSRDVRRRAARRLIYGRLSRSRDILELLTNRPFGVSKKCLRRP